MIELNLENFEEQVLNSNEVCIALFKNSGCHLCRGMSIVFPRIQKRYQEYFKFATINTGVERELTERFEVDGIPAVFVFVGGDGKEIPYPDDPSHFSGYSEKYLINYLEEFLNNGRQ